MLFNLLTPLAVIALIVGGVMLIASGGSEERQTTGKRIIKNVALGMIIAFGAWLIINTLLLTIGFKIPFSTAIDPLNWNKSPCPLALSDSTDSGSIAVDISSPAFASPGDTITISWTITGSSASSATCGAFEFHGPTPTIIGSGSQTDTIPLGAPSGASYTYTIRCIIDV